jgi:hypothetical protein
VTTTSTEPLSPPIDRTDTVLDDAPDLMGTLRDAEDRARQMFAATITTDIVAWLDASGLDDEDRDEFLRDLAASLAGSAEDVMQTLRDWRITAEALQDPIRREVLIGGTAAADYTEVDRPQ